MLIISEEDFYQKISSIPRLRREEEIKYATLMKNGDYEARQLIAIYLWLQVRINVLRKKLEV